MSRAFLKENDMWAFCAKMNRECMFADPHGDCGLKRCKYEGELSGSPSAPRPASTQKKAPVPGKVPSPSPMTQTQLSKITVGAAVSHPLFGAGQITQLSRTFLMVRFDGEEKRFPFPGAFLQGYLTL